MKIPHTTNLSGKTVAITGGGGVLCGGMAHAMAAAGARVAVLDLRQTAANAVAEQIAASGGQAHSGGLSLCAVLSRMPLKPLPIARRAWESDGGAQERPADSFPSCWPQYLIWWR